MKNKLPLPRLKKILLSALTVCCLSSLVNAAGVNSGNISVEGPDDIRPRKQSRKFLQPQAMPGQKPAKIPGLITAIVVSHPKTQEDVKNIKRVREHNKIVMLLHKIFSDN